MANWVEYYSMIKAMLEGDEVAGLAAEDWLDENSENIRKNFGGKAIVDAWRRFRDDNKGSAMITAERYVADVAWHDVLERCKDG